MRQRYHQHEPSKETIRCVLVYRNFAACSGLSHIGLGVSAINTSQVLQAMGLWVDVWAVTSAEEIEAKLIKANVQAQARGEIFVSHIIISALWIDHPHLSGLITRHPNVHWAVTSHSNVAFLGADPTGMKFFREALELQTAWSNFHIAANGQKFLKWVKRAFGIAVTWLPNLYNLEPSRNIPPRPSFAGGVLRIGSFGAMRILKNHVTACAAALEISRRLGVDTEFWLSSGRMEGAGGALKTMKEMTQGIPGFTLKFNAWSSWTQFRNFLRNMNLLLQPSFTESFNMVTADGVAEGVPSVVSDAIEWVPIHWQACADNALDIANKGIALLQDPQAAYEGKEALIKHNQAGEESWLKYFLNS